MLTKEDIWSTSLYLFNDRGIATVSMRQIAEELGISPGNLTYHFKTKAAIVSTIYREMHLESVDYIEPEGYVSLDEVDKILTKFYQLRQKYSFFFNDVVFIIRQFPSVGRMYEASNQIRFEKAVKLINYFIETERIQPEPLLISYEKLIHNLWMINTFWSAQQQIMQSTEYRANKTTATDMAWQLLIPILTEKGRSEFLQIKKYANNYN